MPENLPPEKSTVIVNPGHKLPGRGQDWLGGIIGTLVVALLGLQGIKVGDIKQDQVLKQQDLITIMEKIDTVTSAAMDTRKDFMRKLNQIDKDLERLLTLLEKETP